MMTRGWRARTALAAGLILLSVGCAQTPESGRPAPNPHGLQIALANNDRFERATRDRLLALSARYPIAPFLFTKNVWIHSGGVPFSHPTLTLNSRYRDAPLTLLTVFIHEQLHWYADLHADRVFAAVDELDAAYPDTPLGWPIADKTRKDTLLHLIICALELDAMTALIGETQARQTLQERNAYRWIYEQVLDHPKPIRAAMARHGIHLPFGDSAP